MKKKKKEYPTQSGNRPNLAMYSAAECPSYAGVASTCIAVHATWYGEQYAKDFFGTAYRRAYHTLETVLYDENRKRFIVQDDEDGRIFEMTSSAVKFYTKLYQHLGSPPGPTYAN